MPMERRVDSARDDERAEHTARRDRERTRRMTLEAEGPTPAKQPHAEAAALRQVKSELSEKIERECAHVDAVLSERIDGVRELLDQRISDQTRLLRAEFNSLEAKLAHETGALRTEIGSVADRMEASLAHETRTTRTELVHETGTLRAETAGLKEQIDARLAHDFGTVRTGIAGVKEQIDTRLAHDFGAVRTEIAGLKEQIDTRLAHDFGAVDAEFGAVRKEFAAVRKEIAHESGALRAEIAGLKELLLGRMEQQEKVRAAEYLATKWSIRSMMAAMALLVAMMARFTLFQ